MEDTATLDLREVVCAQCLQVLGESETYAGDQVLFACHLPVCPEWQD